MTKTKETPEPLKQDFLSLLLEIEQAARGSSYVDNKVAPLRTRIDSAVLLCESRRTPDQLDASMSAPPGVDEMVVQCIAGAGSVARTAHPAPGMLTALVGWCQRAQSAQLAFEIAKEKAEKKKKAEEEAQKKAQKGRQ